MLSTRIKAAMVAMAATGLTLTAAPSQAAEIHVTVASAYSAADMTGVGANWERSRRYNDRRYYREGYRSRDYYAGDRVHRNTRVWRGNDGRYYCRRDNGTTGLLVGAAVGGLAGHEIAGRGDRTLGALIGAVGGGLLGREIDKGNSRCR